MNNITDFFRGKTILIWGFGKEGQSTYNFIRKHLGDVPIAIADQNPIVVPNENTQIIEYSSLSEVIGHYDIVMKSPGISLANMNIPMDNICSQTDLFMQSFANQVIGVTGTKGKSTTVSLLYHVLKACKNNVLLVGNIGNPCFDYINAIDINTVIIFELSCHQLEFIKHSPYIAVLLNIYEEHLDHYASLEKYVAAKHNIYAFQTNTQILIVNSECENIRKETNVISVSITDENADILIQDKSVIVDREKVLSSSDTKLKGSHNLFNIGIVYYICNKFFGISRDNFKKHLFQFNSLPHRLEYIDTIDGVAYYDDSISTTCESAISAVKSVENIGTIILGGMDRGIKYNKLVDFLVESNVENIILVPNTSVRLEKLFSEKNRNVIMASGLEEAVELAKKYTPKGKACVLSPAAASYGFYKNFEERGNEFQRLIKL